MKTLLFVNLSIVILFLGVYSASYFGQTNHYGLAPLCLFAGFNGVIVCAHYGTE